MKKIICKCSQIIAVLLFSVNVMAQTSFSYHLGASKPLGDFANSRAEDRGDVIWYDLDSKKGGAGMGLNLGVKMKSDIASIEGLGFIFTTDVFYNGANEDVKEWKNELLEEFEDEYEYDESKLTLPKWLNIPVMVGLNYEYAINDDFGIWTEFGAGANLGKLTNHKGFFEIDNWEYTHKDVYEFKVSAAVQLGVGVKLSDKISMGVHYYSFGNRRIEGQCFEDVNGEEYDDKFKCKSITPTMLTFRIGYHF